ncbi:MAG: aminomethyl-transferring glycine dehydrogenase subunit GcvPA [Planctomycetota bacterium]|nr:MAG: aminomethyl-transferring glycine dehydrogenase subunit GcvPA [Planctomycetota bacterium]
MAYTPHTPDDLAAMLAVVGVPDVESLFETVPKAVRLNRLLDIPAAMNELELTRYASEIAGRNQSAGTEICFMGGGFYDHFIPALVDQLASRGEFYTAYTPYQAEASQGTLQAIFEFQTLVAQITGMDLANASLYECATAVVEAAFLAMTSTGRLGRIVMSDAVHPEHRQTLATYLTNLETELVIVPSVNQRTRPEDIAAALTDDTAAVVIQQPNFFGTLEDAETLVQMAHEKGSLAILSVDPISLGLLRNPGLLGADIVVGEGQSLGNIMSFGGPSLGLFACRSEFMRKMPGRLVGETVDRNGKRCFTLTLQTREQHIRREKATSNICTNQGLMALRAAIYLADLGPGGFRQVAETSARQAHKAAARLAQIPGVERVLDGPFFREFVVRFEPGRLASVAAERVRSQGILAGIPLSGYYPDRPHDLLVAVTEKRTDSDIQALALALEVALACA